jgi:transcription elongation factor GreA
MKDVVLTQEGLEKIKEELTALKKRRKEIIGRIQIAKEFGDLSENAEYDDARNEQSFVEGRIQELEEMVKHAKIVTKHASKDGHVVIGSKVTVTCEGEEEVYELVGVNESDPVTGKVSVESPIGKALLGTVQGETVIVDTPGGKLEYTVKEVAS